MAVVTSGASSSVRTGPASGMGDAAQSPAAQPRVLIADEDRILTSSLAQYLRRLGYPVETTTSPENALDAAESCGAELLLIDTHAPNIDAKELLRDAKRRFPALVVVVITAYGSIESAVAAVKAGAFDYLTKPIVDEEIRSVIEKASRQQVLLSENVLLRKQLDVRFGFENIVGTDHRLTRNLELLSAVADSKATVLMQGESGTGKSLLARALHHQSARRSKPFVEISCGSLPETLLESELFGHVKGSFTGAISDKPGRFLTADGGTLFLDEINSAPPSMQVKLLRVLQERAFEPVGSSQTKTVDVRVILASNVDLASLVASGAFRQDLYYRVNVVSVKLPPLRERQGDIPALARSFLARHARNAGREIVGFSDAAMSLLARHNWPGNVRELENAVERAVVVCRKNHIEPDDLPEHIYTPLTANSAEAVLLEGAAPSSGHGSVAFVPSRPVSLSEALDHAERAVIEAALKRNNYSRQATSSELGIDRTTLYKKMRRYKLDIGESN